MPISSGIVGEEITCPHCNPGRNGPNPTKNLHEGDVVLLKDNQAARNSWPLAVVTKAFSGGDGRVRKVELKTTDQGHAKTFFRPVSEVILLLAKD